MRIFKVISAVLLAVTLTVAQQQTPAASSQQSQASPQSQPQPSTSQQTAPQQTQPEQQSVPGLGVSVQDQSQSSASAQTGEKPQKPSDTEVGPAKGQTQQNPAGSQQQPQQQSQGQAQEKEQQQAEPEQKITPEQAQELFQSIDEIMKFDSKATGFAEKHTVKKQLSSRDEVERFIEQRMKDDKDAKRLERSELVLKKLGLLPLNFNLRTFLVALLKEQVAGYYDSKTKTVYLLDWLGPEAQKPVMAHELTHALQDQNFDLEKFAKSAEVKGDVDSDERIAARQAVEEGQAMIALLDYVLSAVGKDVQSDPAAVDAMLAAMNAGGSTPKLAEAPAYLRDVLIFPYNWGTDFVRDVLTKKGRDAAFAGLFRDPPHDTREVMEPDVYLAGQHLPPTKVPDFDKTIGNGYKKYDVSGIGEFDVWEIAKQFGSEDGAKNVAKGFRGGYSYVATKGKGDPKTTGDMNLLLVTSWSSPEMAQRFAKMWGISVAKRYTGAKPNGDGAWTTNDGPVTIETRDNTVLVVESFDQNAAAKARTAVFGEAKAASAGGR
jgi:hypothetical protein